VNCPPEKPAPIDGLVSYTTSAMDSLQGSFSNRAFRACKKVFVPSDILLIGKHHVIFQGELPAGQVEQFMLRLHSELRALCSDPMMVAADKIYWLGIGDEPFADRE
jgi:hypothetical protein